MKNCKHCNTGFQSTDEDRLFYKKMDVSEPTLCPPCRQQRRMTFRNERSLYKRKCDLTGESFIGIYPDNSPFKVYSPDAWYTDKWDATEYGRDFDFSRPFFEQYAELQKAAPRIGQIVVNLENCPYMNQAWYSKDSYLCFDMGFCEHNMFCDITYHSDYMVDCLSVRNSGYSYQLVDCNKCNNSIFLQDCTNCNDSYFSYDCNGCNNIAFCSNLRNKSYHLFNKPVSKEEFERIVSDIKSGSHLKWQEYTKVFINKVMTDAIRKENHNLNTENCLGDYLQNCKNAELSFDCSDSEDLRYVTRGDEKIKSSMDVDNCSLSEVAYESLCISGHNTNFTFNSFHQNNTDLYYCDTIVNCQNCFGCIALHNKKYCILNKEYSKEEYEKLVPKIIEHMKSTGEWGEFFSASLSPFSYNESVAQIYYPLEKSNVINYGWRWKDVDNREYQAQKIEIPDNISDFSDDSMNEVLSCESCKKNYKIISQEFSYYKNIGLPIPRTCPTCRYHDRFNMRNPHNLFKRNCDKCSSPIQTTYSPDNPEKVYCEECYLKEVY